MLGQFFTTNYDYILTGFKEEIINSSLYKNLDLVEPFAGGCDLLKWANHFTENYGFFQNKELYDIEIQEETEQSLPVICRDTLLDPPDYENKFILTNPPYLALNKSKENKIVKEVCSKYKQDDLYKCFMKSIIINKPSAGVIIIPVNFLSSIRKSDVELRSEFFSNFYITRINIFEEQVFSDTKYSVCAIQFISNENFQEAEINESKILIFQNRKQKSEFMFNFKNEQVFNKKNNCLIGGDIYDTDKFIISKDMYVNRLTKNNCKELGITRLLVKCIDDNSKKIIHMKYLEEDDKIYIDDTENLSARSFMTLIIRKNDSPIDEYEQRQLAELFNEMLNKYRKEYNSLFLANYRESSDISRKRISFSLVYNLVKHILYTKM